MTKQQIYELKHKRAEKITAANDLLAKKDMKGWESKMAEVDTLNAEIDASEKLLAEEGRFDDGEEKYGDLSKAREHEKEQEAREKNLDDIRGSNEYVKAFAKAMKGHANVKESAGVADFAPLYKALQESGGTPTGADGGFLVPVDFDNRIERLAKEYLDLSTFFDVQLVTTLSGWRVVEDGVPKKLPSVAEMGTIGKDDQPKLKRIDYSVTKYADRLPISNELLDDNAANLLAYVADWFAPKYVLTKNSLLLPLLAALASPVSLTAGSEDTLLRKALITRLNTAHSRLAVLLTNQSGYAEMDSWADTTGRPLLVPNPADAQVMRYRGRRVAYGDDAEFPNGETAIPIYVGNFQALGTLFVRKGIELATTNVGGDAWATDSTEVRVICRLDAKEKDSSAAFRAEIPTGV